MPCKMVVKNKDEKVSVNIVGNTCGNYQVTLFLSIKMATRTPEIGSTVKRETGLNSKHNMETWEL